ncbi:MAG: DUF6600 domain-containing protein [Acidobacteriaceae bacterium]
MLQRERFQATVRNFGAASLLLAVPVLVAAQNGVNNPGGANAQAPPNRVARLTQIKGKVSMQPAGVSGWTQALGNYPWTTGDRMYVDANGQAELQMEQAVVHVWHYSDLSGINVSDTTTQLGLAQGSLHVRTFELHPGRPVEIDTPNGAITVLQPGDFRIDCYTSDGGTVVTVNSGEVQITGPNLSQSLGPGHAMRFLGQNPITVMSMQLPGKDPFDVWSQLRDRRLLSSQSRQYVNPGAIGSDDLDQYGSWANAPGYGAVWYPTGVPADWVPYSAGRWIWVAPWGWTWVDSDPWGFAPFHYGRWAYYGNRWGWVPGPLNVAPIYSPALVGFLRSPGPSANAARAQLAAWFPLGPGEPFFPSYRSGPTYFSQVNMTNIDPATITRVTDMTHVDTASYYNYYHRRNAANSIRYVNRNMATLAERGSGFASGLAVLPQTAIHPMGGLFAHAEVVSHPLVAPTERSLVPSPIASVPVPKIRRSLMTPTVPLKGAAQQNHAAVPANLLRSSPAPGGVGGSTMASSAVLSNAPMSGSILQQAGRPLITRIFPPPVQPTFRQCQPFFANDPGRPLDPQQMDNISHGHPAGPAR